MSVVTQEQKDHRKRIEAIVRLYWPCVGSRWADDVERCGQCCGYKTIAGRACPLCGGRGVHPAGRFEEPEALEGLVDHLENEFPREEDESR